MKDFDSEAKELAMEFDKLKSMGQRAYKIRQALTRAYKLGRIDSINVLKTLEGGSAAAKPPPPMTFEAEGGNNG